MHKNIQLSMQTPNVGLWHPSSDRCQLTDNFVLVLKYQEVYNHTDNTLYQAAFLLVLQLLTMLIETHIKPKSFELRWNQLLKKILDGHTQSLLQVCLDAMLLPQS